MLRAYLGVDLAERRELAGLLRAFYGARSKAVHRGEVSATYTMAGQTVAIAELIVLVQELCLRSIRKAIDGDLPRRRRLGSYRTWVSDTLAGCSRNLRSAPAWERPPGSRSAAPSPPPNSKLQPPACAAGAGSH